MSRFPLRFRRLAGDRKGIAIVEFALLVPVLFTLFLGSYETARLLLCYLKLESAAETAADLIAQIPQSSGGTNVYLVASGSTNGWDFANIGNAVSQVMTPFPAAGLTIVYASIIYSNCTTTCTATVDWTYPSGSTTFGAAGSTATNLPNGAATTTLGGTNNDSVIVVKVTYSYTSPLGYVLHTNYTLSESAFNRPRYVICVPTYMDASNSCPNT